MFISAVWGENVKTLRLGRRHTQLGGGHGAVGLAAAEARVPPFLQEVGLSAGSCQLVERQGGGQQRGAQHSGSDPLPHGESGVAALKKGLPVWGPHGETRVVPEPHFLEAAAACAPRFPQQPWLPPGPSETFVLAPCEVAISTRLQGRKLRARGVAATGGVHVGLCLPTSV